MQSIDGNHQVSGDFLAILCPQLPGSAQNDQTFSFFPNGLSLVCDAERMAGCRCFGHLGGSQAFFFPNGFSPLRGADTLHVVGSYHDPTTCKVSEQNMLSWSSRAAPDAMVVLVGIRVIRSGFVREMFFLIS
jgi:hypothetical protein